jgi:hypothetical protein
MVEVSNNTTEVNELLSRSNLFDLHKHYWSVSIDELRFCHQYLNFYSGLLSFILAATLTGLLGIKFGDLRGLALLIGPLLTVVLAINGYSTVQAFYRRFVEAWVTIINIESMLHIRYSTKPIVLDPRPVYISNENSFIPMYYWPALKDIFDKAKNEEWKAEKVAERLSKIGTTLTNAKITFIAFGLAGLILAVFILLSTIFPDFIHR